MHWQLADLIDCCDQFQFTDSSRRYRTGSSLQNLRLCRHCERFTTGNMIKKSGSESFTRRWLVRSPSPPSLPSLQLQVVIIYLVLGSPPPAMKKVWFQHVVVRCSHHMQWGWRGANGAKGEWRILYTSFKGPHHLEQKSLISTCSG